MATYRGYSPSQILSIRMYANPKLPDAVMQINKHIDPSSPLTVAAVASKT